MSCGFVVDKPRLEMAFGDAHCAEGSFAWSVEEAKLLWAQGQQAVAVRMSKSLLDVARHDSHGDVVAYARLLSLTGKWLAESRLAPCCCPTLTLSSACVCLVSVLSEVSACVCYVPF